jgi:hypothetical protein
MVELVSPDLDSGGRLPAAIHTAAWNGIASRFGLPARRERLLLGLRQGFGLLRAAGCRLVCLDGRFVPSKPEPGDFDACWGIDGVDVAKLDPIFLDFADGRARQNERFLGELFPADIPEGLTGKTFPEFFQAGKETAKPKGIVAIGLGRRRRRSRTNGNIALSGPKRPNSGAW